MGDGGDYDGAQFLKNSLLVADWLDGGDDDVCHTEPLVVGVVLRGPCFTAGRHEVDSWAGQ